MNVSTLCVLDIRYTFPITCSTCSRHQDMHGVDEKFRENISTQNKLICLSKTSENKLYVINQTIT